MVLNENTLYAKNFTRPSILNSTQAQTGEYLLPP